MIRVTLRQFRTEGVIGLGLLAVLAVVVAATGPHLAGVNSAYHRACNMAVQPCIATPNPAFRIDLTLQAALPFLVTIGPALIGVFFSAPLLGHELETGTFRLAWTQSVTRGRWLTAKLGLIGAASMAIAGLLTWTVDWWAAPLEEATKNRFDPGPFAWHGVAAVGYAAFAFALGTAAGALLRRTVPAMAAPTAGCNADAAGGP